MATLKASSTKAKPSGATNPNHCQGGWTHDSTCIVFKGGDCGSDGSALTCVPGANTSNVSTRNGVWVYGPLAAQNISGCVTTTIRARCTVFTNSEHPNTAIYIMKPCGVKRATLLARTGPACLMSTVCTDFTFTNALTSACAVAGDYLVMEAGGQTCFLCIATFDVVSGSTGPHTRWVFTQGTIVLQTGVPNQLMLMGVGT